MARRLQDHALNTAVSIASLFTVTSGSPRLQAANSRLEALQSDCRSSQLLLAFASPERSGALVQHLQQIESDISVQTAAVLYAQEALSVAERLLPASAFPPHGSHLPLFSPPLTPNTPVPGPSRTLTLILTTPSNTCALKLTQALTHPAIHVDSVTPIPLLPHSLPRFHRFSLLPVPLASSLFSWLNFSMAFHAPSRLLFLPFLFPSPFLFTPLFSFTYVHTGTIPFFINSNGLHDVMKTNAIKQHISSFLLHVWVINETKASIPVASRVSVPGYNIFESPGIRTSRTSKCDHVTSIGMASP